jgi:hypothetical protein
MSIEQHIDDTTYLQWADGMYVMLDDLEDDYEAALVENSLRSSVYYPACPSVDFFAIEYNEDCLGVYDNYAGCWHGGGINGTKLTRAQALYIATGETTCTTS